jgi:hypothetical protein
MQVAIDTIRHRTSATVNPTYHAPLLPPPIRRYLPRRRTIRLGRSGAVADCPTISPNRGINLLGSRLLCRQIYDVPPFQNLTRIGVGANAEGRNSTH